ncbi:MAG: B12-binding domain-containing radical SAM protein [Synergistaceae bacterium]|jgi:radical SAM superfamily enzyme YgiQ (UPF0313 family)|nr:B12-binding domain-containing radical SAM protein [Synergistaceae bacterium]
MNILLILPLSYPYDEIVFQVDSMEWERKISNIKGIKKPDIAYPNGLLSIAAYIKKHYPNVDIRILDFNMLICKVVEDSNRDIFSMRKEEFWGYCLSLIPDFKADIIGISLMFCSVFEDLIPLVGFLRKRFDNIFIAVGGHLATAIYDTILQNLRGAVDAVCYGEGEIPFLELVYAISEGRAKEYLESDNSWVTCGKLLNHVNFTPQNKFIYELDDIPMYDFDVIVERKLYLKYIKALMFSEDREADSTFYMFTTRGCPGRCVFCASQNVHGHNVRYYSTQRVKSDIMHYMSTYGIKSVMFYDDHFLTDRCRAIEILDFMSENKIKTNVANPPFFSISEEVAASLKRAGIKETILAIESGNEETLRNIVHKPGNLDRARESIDYLRHEGIVVFCNLLLGFPGETKEAMEKSIEGALGLGSNWYSCYVVAPLPGSELYEICKKNNNFVPGSDIFKMNFKKGVIQTQDFTHEYVEKKVYETNLLLNFVKNHDMKIGNFALALRLFERVLDDVIDTHAFAYYFSAICAMNLGLNEKYKRYKGRYYEMIGKFNYWREWSEYFKLDDLP